MGTWTLGKSHGVGHVGVWTQKYCIKRSLGKSALVQKGLLILVEVFGGRERIVHVSSSTWVNSKQGFLKDGRSRSGNFSLFGIGPLHSP